MEKRKETKSFSSFINKLTKAAKERKVTNDSFLKKYSENASNKVDESISKIISHKIVPQ